MSETAQSHQAQAAAMARAQPVRCAVLTVSDTRTVENDAGGERIVDHLKRANHTVATRMIVRDDPEAIARVLDGWIADSGIDAVLITGGTGVSRRDGTIEVVRSRLTLELEGYGELFRMLSFEHVKAAAMMSRATGGLVNRQAGEGGDTFVFAMPGSPNAVDVAMERLIAPQLGHMVWERKRQS